MAATKPLQDNEIELLQTRTDLSKEEIIKIYQEFMVSSKF
jgi:hypothetical protein